MSRESNQNGAKLTARGEDRLLTPGQVCQLLGIGWSTLNRLSDDHILPFVQLRPSGWRRYRLSDVQKLMTPSQKNLSQAGLDPVEVD